MTDVLTPNQRSALNRALRHPELLPRLYRKVEGLKWFDVFDSVGLLKPECNPAPKPSSDEGYYQIPTWSITEYLVKTSLLLKENENIEYAIKYRNFLRGVTDFAKKRRIRKLSDMVAVCKDYQEYPS